MYFWYEEGWEGGCRDFRSSLSCLPEGIVRETLNRSKPLILLQHQLWITLHSWFGVCSFRRSPRCIGWTVWAWSMKGMVSFFCYVLFMHVVLCCSILSTHSYHALRTTVSNKGNTSGLLTCGCRCIGLHSVHCSIGMLIILVVFSRSQGLWQSARVTGFAASWMATGWIKTHPYGPQAAVVARPPGQVGYVWWAASHDTHFSAPAPTQSNTVSDLCLA